ncbi:hypothetical protein SF1_18140 [Sphingobacterium faecium NBRC 15299]|jgi:hypothetical protein|uniref:hypothetical protein n=1 Tax=Sphingobacterium faecium TaxID=34087 RepID=UPI000D38FF81|nr:hypothetical protein [Sphingobacterium faecium]PTX09548.1 hypothetical protein C8N37_106177 [Sphingobacterium faecium]UZJ63754.1 hypothetical protein OKW96_15125 [Sphingobacterium sp. KU25419]GEM63832.1 hypothetical protein SF1_18140 [Sphingobacterium faecium NBRC 15299]
MNFTFKLKNIASLAFVAITVFNLSSCKSDDNDVNPAILLDSKATVKTSTIVVPPSTTLYYDLVKNIAAEEKTSTINLSGMYGSTLKPSTTAYKFGYFDLAGKTIDAIKVSDLETLNFTETPSLAIDASSAGQPATGPTWIIYDFKNNHAVYPTANRFIILYKGTTLSKDAEEVIIFNAESVVALNGEATYTLKVKHFAK